MAVHDDEIARRSSDIAYSYERDSESAGDDPPAPCAHCRGTGKVVLFDSAGFCQECGGTGRAARLVGKGGAAGPDPETPAEETPGTWISEFSYDAHGQLVRQRWYVADERAPEAPVAK